MPITCPNCGRVTPELVPVCDCGHSYYPRVTVAAKPTGYTPLTLEEKLDSRASGGLVVGIISIVTSVLAPYGMVFSLIGVLLSVSGMKSEKRRKRAVIGLTCSIIGGVVSAAILILMFASMWFK